MVNYFDDIRFLSADSTIGLRENFDYTTPDYYSLSYIEEGVLSYQVDNAPPSVLHAPFTFWHAPGKRYRIAPVDEAGWTHHWVRFTGPKAEQIFLRGFDKVAQQPYTKIYNKVGYDSLFLLLIKTVKEEVSQRDMYAQILLERLLAHLITDYPKNIASKHFYPLIQQFALRMKQEPTSHYDFKAWSKSQGISYHHFRRLFKEITGISPNHYLKNTRMEWTYRELLRTQDSAYHIGLKIGYEDPNTFSRAFKKHYGSPPSHLRQKYRRGTSPADESAHVVTVTETKVKQ